MRISFSPSLSRLQLFLALVLAASVVAPAAEAAAADEAVPLSPEEGGRIPALREETVPEGDAFAARWERVRQRIERRMGEVGVAADLYEFRELLEQGGSLERAADLLSRVASSRRTHHEVSALARRMLADVERMRGRLPRMVNQLQALGTIRDLSVIGPFDNENKGGYDAVYGPEGTLDLSKTHAGLRSEVAWRSLQGLGATGRIALDEVVRPNRDVVVYALALVSVPEDQAATLYLGTPGATKAWLNGRPVFADPAYHPARFDQRAVEVQLRRGENPLLLKIAVAGEGALDLELRLVRTDGAPIRGLRATAPSSGRFAVPQPIARGQRIAGRRPLVDPQARLAAQGTSSRALEDYARLLAERHPFDEAEKLHQRAAARAARAAPERVEAQLLAAGTATDDHNEQREWLERAVVAERPGEALAHAALAEHWLAHGHPYRAREVMEGRLAVAGADWPAWLVWARALEATGEGARARLGLQVLMERFPGEPALHVKLAYQAARDGQVEEAIRRWRVALALRPADLGAALSLAWRLVDRGAADDGLHLLETAGRLHPLSPSLVANRADLLAANGRMEEGLALYGRALELSPQDGELWRRRAEVELRAGAKDEAIASLERSLEVRPQEARVREQLRRLRAEGASFAKPFLHDLREVAAAAPQADEDAVQLVQLQALQVLPSGQASRTVQRIIRVQSKRGVERYRAFRIRFAPDRDEVRVLQARLLRPDGSVVSTHNEYEQSVNDAWSGLYYDAKVKVVSFPSLAPGDTVELVYRSDDVARENLLSDYFGDFAYLQDTVPTRHWEYILRMPAGRDIHFNEQPLATYQRSELRNGDTLHRWVAANVSKVVPEPQMPGWSEVAAHIHVSTYGDWDQVARYWWGLVRDQVAPSSEIERAAREIVAGIPAGDIEARVRAVHAFVLTRTRYVGLEFGIHSFKPYKVEQVLRRGYGDCKDKASLTYALLQAVGIDSRLVLLRMSNLGRIQEAPASLAVFNHAILYVPALDLYLDGTAEWSGTRELPEVDRGAEILVVEPGGRSDLDRTPEGLAEQNSSRTEQRVELRAEGSARIVGETRVQGLAAPGYRRSYASPNERIPTFERSWARTHPGVKVAELEVSDPREIEEDVRLRFALEAPVYAEGGADGRLSWSPLGSGSSYLQRYAALSTRSFDLWLRYPWTQSFRTELVLPAGARLERLPPAGAIRSSFGSLDLHYEEADGILRVDGRLQMTATRVRPEDYAAFRAFLRQVDTALSAKVTILAPVLAPVVEGS